MNKAKAYRELQRRQNKIHKIWSNSSAVAQSVDSSVAPPRYNGSINAASTVMHSRPPDYGTTSPADVDNQKVSVSTSFDIHLYRISRKCTSLKPSCQSGLNV